MPIFNRKRKERVQGNGQQAEKKIDQKCRRTHSGHVRQKTEKCFVFDTDTVGRLRSFSAKKQTNKLELHFVLVALSLTQLLRAKEVFIRQVALNTVGTESAPSIAGSTKPL